MKTNRFTLVLAAFTALILCVAGCNVPGKETATAEASVMSAGKKQAIETEILGLTKAFFQEVEKLDIERCMTYFANTPDFLAVNPDGTFGDYDALKKLNADAFSQMTAFRVTPKKEAVRVLSDTQALYTFTVGQAGTLKTGRKINYENVAGTMLFTNVNGAWKATFYQESAPAPVAVK